jgi:hypothetical protein
MPLDSESDDDEHVEIVKRPRVHISKKSKFSFSIFF